MGCDCGCSFAKHIGEDIIQLDIGNGQAVLRAILFACGKICEFIAVTYQVPELADIRGRNKAAGNKVVLEDVSNPLSVFFVRFLLEKTGPMVASAVDELRKALEA